MRLLQPLLRVIVSEALNDRSLLLLAVLYDRGSQSMVELARACLCTSAGVTGLVDKLDVAGLTAREVRGSGDRRKVMVRLTEEGRTMVLALCDRLEAELWTNGLQLRSQMRPVKLIAQLPTGQPASPGPATTEDPFRRALRGEAHSGS